MPPSERYEVVIVRTGARGGTLAYRLANAGKRILILEGKHPNGLANSSDMVGRHTSCSIRRTPFSRSAKSRNLPDPNNLAQIANGRVRLDYTPASVESFATCRFGTDPMQSVLDIDRRTHDLDNPYLVDGSFFASSGAVHPSRTIIANALRVGDQLLERLH